MQNNKLLISNKDFFETWPYYFNLALCYYYKYGNLEIPFLFKTINGETYNENGYALGKWVSLNYKNYKYLTEDMKKRLYSIKFASGAVEVKWLHNFNLAKKYYDYHGNLRLMRDYKTNDGINYDENGETLGIWISMQRKKYKKLKNESKTFLDIEHEQLLENIGMIWDVYENTNIVKNICRENNIDYKENFEYLSCMQYQELITRINHLKDKNIELVNTDNSLNSLLLINKKEFNKLFEKSLSQKRK